MRLEEKIIKLQDAFVARVQRINSPAGMAYGMTLIEAENDLLLALHALGLSESEVMYMADGAAEKLYTVVGA